MSLKIGFFEENEGERSWTRLTLFILVIWFLVLSGYITITDGWNITNSAFMSAYLASVLGAKYWSKKEETKQLPIG